MQSCIKLPRLGWPSVMEHWDCGTRWSSAERPALWSKVMETLGHETK